ncbi:hypothetical protein ABLV76_12245 [Klebsiella sp. GB_Kp047]|uniref:hypothetical protein n=1 Tax=Klebsiella TaxID=570 RepID=UPI00115B754D|nr:hypothetical protein [Klebsiella quasipneumoniae]HBQ1033535.1 hypothetical protein [Klebsiella pneumoniae]
MIKIDELKEAISSFDNISDMNVTDKGVRFKYQGINTIANTYEGDNVAFNKIDVMNSFKSPELFESKVAGEKIAEVVNMTSMTPSKTTYIHLGEEGGAFVCRNIFSDKLNTLKYDDEVSKERFLANLRVVILGMMLENYNCFYDIKEEASKLIEGLSDESK